MNELEFNDPEDIFIKDNVLHINCGYRSDNLIPLSTIWFVGEVITHKVNGSPQIDADTDKRIYYFTINEQVRIQTKPYLRSDSETFQIKIYAAYDKLKDALHDYHTNTFRINKPKELNHESIKKD